MIKASEVAHEARTGVDIAALLRAGQTIADGDEGTGPITGSTRRALRALRWGGEDTPGRSERARARADLDAMARAPQDARGVLGALPETEALAQALRRHGGIRANKARGDTRFRRMVELAEVTGTGMRIGREALVPTEPQSVARFAHAALEAFDAVCAGERYAATGRWLEALAQTHQVHAIEARTQLEAAREAGHVRRWVEGSTPDTRHPSHRIAEVVKRNGRVMLRRWCIYEGDLLIPGRAATSVRVERGQGRGVREMETKKDTR